MERIIELRGPDWSDPVTWTVECWVVPMLGGANADPNQEVRCIRIGSVQKQWVNPKHPRRGFSFVRESVCGLTGLFTEVRPCKAVRQRK